MSGPMKIIRVVSGAILSSLAFVACSEEPANVPRAGLHIVEGRSGIDTIEAVLARPLVIELRDEALQPLTGRTIRIFTYALPKADSNFTYTSGVTLTSPDITGTLTQIYDALTDANGRVTLQVRLGQAVGQTKVLAGAVVGQHPRPSDSATFTIRPGRPARVTIAPRDTTLYPAARLQLRQTTRDRFGFPTSGIFTPTFSASNELVVSSTGIVTPRIPGRDTIIARSGPFADTVLLSTLPIKGTVAMSLPGIEAGANGVAVMGLDGSNYKEFAKNMGPLQQHSTTRPMFTYDGLALVVRASLQSDQRLWTVPLDGSAPRRLFTTPVAGAEDWPSPSPDGQWIYFCGNSTAPNRSYIFRVRPTGAGNVEQLPSPSPPQGDDLCALPTASADGQWIAWHVPGTGIVVSRSVATGARDAFRREGYWPAAAPAGTRLAYIKGNPGPMYTSEFDGSGDQLIEPGLWSGPISWSPDRKYLMAVRTTSFNTQQQELIEVATGKTYVVSRKVWPDAVLKSR